MRVYISSTCSTYEYVTHKLRKRSAEQAVRSAGGDPAGCASGEGGEETRLCTGI